MTHFLPLIIFGRIWYCKAGIDSDVRFVVQLTLIVVDVAGLPTFPPPVPAKTTHGVDPLLSPPRMQSFARRGWPLRLHLICIFLFIVYIRCTCDVRDRRNTRIIGGPSLFFLRCVRTYSRVSL